VFDLAKGEEEGGKEIIGIRAKRDMVATNQYTSMDDVKR